MSLSGARASTREFQRCEASTISRNSLNVAFPTIRSKQSILAARSELHGIALLRSGAGFPIELVCYPGEWPDAVGRFVGVFEGCQPASDDDYRVEMFAGLSVPGDLQWQLGSITGLEAPAFFTGATGGAAGLRKLVLYVADLEQACRFWCGAMGFAREEAARDWIELQFASPVPAWRIRMVLFQSSFPETRLLLDARGMTCLSFLSSNISDDVQRLVAAGAQPSTNVFDVSINGRDMKVAILATPDRAFVELLQVVQ